MLLVVGCLDLLDFLVESKLGLPHPQKVIYFLQRDQQQPSFDKYLEVPSGRMDICSTLFGGI